MENLKRPGLGLSILVLNDKNQILLSQRLKSKNTMATPGGHLERFEELEETCQRELLEETGLSLKTNDFRYLFFKNIIRKDQDYHYMDFYYVCRCPTEQNVVNTEPESHTDWEWVDLETVFGKDLNWFYGMQEFITEMKNKEECLNRLKQALYKSGDELSPLYYHTKARFQDFKNMMEVKFDEAMFKMEGVQSKKTEFSSNRSSMDRLFPAKNQKKQILQPLTHKNYHTTGRKLKLSHIINGQNDQIKRIKYNEKSNITRVLTKSAELQRRVLDCDEDLDLDFYNTVNKKVTAIPEVLPFKHFRQKRFVKVSTNSISKLREKTEKINDKLEHTKDNLNFLEDPTMKPMPFFMKFRKRKQTQINIPRNFSPFSSPLVSKSVSPQNRGLSLVSLSPATRYDPSEVKNNLMRKLRRKRASSGFMRQKRLGFMQEDRGKKKKKESFEADPFQALMWGKIMAVRPQGKVKDAVFENCLLRMAMDRKEKLTAMNEVIGFEGIRDQEELEEKLKELHEEKVEENSFKQGVYCELMLDLYNRKDHLSETEIKFMDLLKKLIEKGFSFSFREARKLVSQRFTKEQRMEKEFIELFDRFEKKIEK